MQRANKLIQVEQLIAGMLEPEAAERFQVASIRENRLILISPSASWATRLRMYAPQLVDRLHRSGFKEIEHIDIRVAPLAGKSDDQRKKRPLSAAARQALEVMARIEADDKEQK